MRVRDWKPDIISRQLKFGFMLWGCNKDTALWLTKIPDVAQAIIHSAHIVAYQ